MSVLDEYFALLTEGEKDVHHRRHAQDVLRRAVAALRTPKAAQAMETGGDAPTVNLGKLLGDKELEDLDLRFVQGDSEKRGGSFRVSSVHNPTIELNLKDEVPTEPSALSKVLEMKRDIFLHEFIHFLDHQRMGDRGTGVMMRAGAAQSKVPGEAESDRLRRYVNDPVEYNAFFQQGVGNIENYLKSLPPESQLKVAQKMLGGSPNEFWKRVTDMFRKQPWFNDLFVKNLNGDNMQKFKKRSAQAYTEIMKSLEAGQKWRGGPEKDKAARIAKLKASNQKVSKERK